MTVYDFAKKLMADEEFNAGGIIPNERKYLDAIGFRYIVEDGIVVESGDDLRSFYEAMQTILALNDKYLSKK